MTKKRITIILIGLVLIAGIIGFMRFRFNQQAVALIENLQTVAAEFGSLEATVGGTGTVRANQTANLLWLVSGTVDEVGVLVGEKVSQNDVLATLVETSLPQSVILAKADLINAEDSLEQLNDSYEGIAISQAIQAVAEAEILVEDTQRRYNSLNSPAGQSYIDQAEATLILTEQALDKAHDKFDPYENKADSLLRATLLGRLAQAQQDYDLAVARYNNLTGTARASDLTLAQANSDLAEAQLEEARAELERLLEGAKEDEVIAIEARITAAKATLNLALIQAPFDGTITQASPKIGDQVSSGLTAFRLDDLSRLLVDVEISEVDINRITLGQSVLLTFDAILAKEFEGTVVEVALVGVPNQGLVIFNVTVELMEKDDQIKPGMTAGVNIVVTELENAMLIPNRAVRVLDGERVVYVLNGSEIEPIQVVLGSSSDIFSEMLDGDLQAGDLIVLNPPTNFQGFGGPPGGGGGGFGGGN